jgi:HAE1 family hydrophobic/amphiphilic exporter-1
MIRTSIRRPVTITMAYFVIAALGVLAWRNMPIEFLPDVQLPKLTVAASMSGASPEVVEALLTSPLEAVISQVQGVDSVTSTSIEGSASINVTFALEADMEFARLELSDRLSAFWRSDAYPASGRSSAPRVSPYVPRAFSEQNSPLLTYTVTGPYTLEYLREHVMEEMEPVLSLVNGVGRVDVSGGRARVLAIELEEQKILSLGLTPERVRSAVTSMEIVRQAGAVDVGPDAFRPIAVRQRAGSVGDIRTLPVLMNEGRIVRVQDVGRVFETLEEPTSYYRIDAFPALQFTIFRNPRTNAVETAELVKAAVLDLEPGFPSGMSATLDQDQSTQIKKQLSDVRNRALIAASIVLLVLLAFLRSVRAALVVFTTVVFAVLITINVMYFGKFSLNVLTMMGLAMGFGLVVDNAIVVLENIFRYRRLGMPALEAAEYGARSVVLPILAATATTIVVLIPFVYLQGEQRIYYVPLATVVGLALIASLFVAFTYIPSLGARLLGRVKPRKDVVVTGTGVAAYEEAASKLKPQFFLVRAYGGLVGLSLKAPWVIVFIALGMLGGSYYLFNKYVTRNVLWGSFGYGQDTYVEVRIIQPRGESLARTDELTRYFEDKLKRMPEVAKFVTRVSAQNSSIRATFPEELELTAVPVAVKEQMVQYSLGFGGTQVRVYGTGPSFAYGGGGGAAPNYRITILGYNYEKVREIAEDMGQHLLQFSRIRDVDTNSAGGYTRDKATEVVVDVDRARLSLHDLSAAEVVSYVSAAVRGRNTSGRAGNIRVAGEEKQLMVKLQDVEKMDVFRLQETLIPAPSGEAVRLEDIASIYERQVLTRVLRENQQYARDVAYEFRGPAKLGDRVKETVLNATMLPPGYSIKERQYFSFSVDDRRQIWNLLAVSFILVFMVTAALFESLRQPFCVLLTVPMALIGVFYTFFLVNASFTREAYIGVIMMGGIVVNNAILLVDHVNQLRRKHGVPLEEALVRGTQERVRPILMTSLTTIFGLLPLVMFSATANSNIWNALAYALIGGLASSTVLVLTVTPSLYLLFEKPRAPWAWWLARRRARRSRLAESTA